MRNLLLSLIALIGFSSSSFSSHLYGGEITINHISGYDYELKATLYVDFSGIQAPGSIIVDSYSKANNALMHSWTLPHVSTDTVPKLSPNCINTFNYMTGILHYSDTIVLDSGYNNAAGYLFAYSNCCMAGNVMNLTNPSSNGITLALDFPAVQKTGAQFLNSSPTWAPIFPDLACLGIQKTMVNQAMDPDGDSLSYEFYAPFSGNYPSGGTFAPVTFAPGYSATSPMNSISLNNTNGDITMNPSTIGVHSFGVKAMEYRNGNLIGTSYRQYHMAVVNCNSNIAPSSQFVGVSPTGSLVNGNNITFGGGPGEIIFKAWDSNFSPASPETLSFSADISGWGSGVSSFSVSSYPLASATDTVLSSISFLPDSLTPNVISVDIITHDNGCGDLTDTLHFDVTFIGYPSAGMSGSTTVNVLTTGSTVDLITHLGGNPDPGGVWTDDDNTGGLNGGILITDNIPNGTYRYTYTVNSLNYPSVSSHVDVTVNNTMLGLFGSKRNGELKVFPNPSNGTYNILLPDNFDPNSAWVYDLMGRKVFDCPISKNLHELDLRNLAKGVYRLEIRGQETLQATLIKE